MSVQSRETILERVRGAFGDNTSDDVISIVEDINDTLSDYENRMKDSTDWKTKYDELDANWRKRYIDRFYSPETTRDEIVKDQQEDVTDDGTEITFDELFKEREG